MIDSIINVKEINDADVVIIGVPYERTVSSMKGTKNGPKAIIKMLDSKLELFDRTYKIQLTDKIRIGQKNLGNINLLSPEKALSKITFECEEILDKNKFILLIGGEHSVSLGLLQALGKRVNPKDVTILDIDAHCDLRENDSDYNEKNPTNLAHSCVMRNANKLGYNIVEVGVRTYYKDEYKFFNEPKNNIKVFEWGNGKKIPSIDEILGSIKTKYIYITIDVDGFDPAHMPGTGTAVQGGLEWWYGLELIERAADSFGLIGADITEVAPMRDSTLTEYGAAQLAYMIIAHKFRGKLI